MITGFFPGRIRLRAPVFKDNAITERALSILKDPALSSIIKDIEYNSVTGSVLLKYHPTKVPIAKLRPLFPFFQKLEKEAEIYSEKNKPVILAMLDELEGYIKNWEII
jgi:hypothetical protein